MNQRSRQTTFDDCVDQQLTVKNPKICKTKFMKDLNYKSHAIIRSEKNNKLNENSREKDAILNKQRSRKNSEIQLMQMKSLLERVIPGARIISGEWKDRKLNGDVVIQYDNGNRFVGKYQNGVRVEGKMTYSELKCQYEGLFFAQKFSGSGKLTYQGGRSIQGQWDNMEFIGNATITYPNKDVYYGPVDQKLYKHGQGYLFLHNGQKYVGSFCHGSLTGIGSYYKDDVFVIKGQWLKGKLIKQLGIGEETEGLEGTSSSPPNQDIQAMKQSSGSMFSYRFKDKDEINYTPKQQQNNNTFEDFSDSFISINQKNKKKDNRRKKQLRRL